MSGKGFLSKFFSQFMSWKSGVFRCLRTNLSCLMNVQCGPGSLARLRSILIRNPQENLRSFKLTRSAHLLGFMIIQHHPAKELIKKIFWNFCYDCLSDPLASQDNSFKFFNLGRFNKSWFQKILLIDVYIKISRINFFATLISRTFNSSMSDLLE